MYYLGIDLGGTNIAVGVVDEDCKIVAKANSSTATDNAEQIADAMAETAREALKKAGITLADVPWVGLGSPGTVNKASGIIEYANNLPFRDTPCRRCSPSAWTASRFTWRMTQTQPRLASTWLAL